ncbi:nuclear pore complex protein (nucleoporin nup116) [Vairimorpha apis BRL 01]|uniref:Nuclear pore complex protein (Nucleoporin nup116) n=1 Tax=Vairimorpha apis BRL 01 TaxID=1037528 RepID=T0L6I4_9MICR|nr:nuclear pore complex protein (nucleoporin nup116) [Vairimorpha apis BRL 01]
MCKISICAPFNNLQNNTNVQNPFNNLQNSTNVQNPFNNLQNSSNTQDLVSTQSSFNLKNSSLNNQISDNLQLNNNDQTNNSLFLQHNAYNRNDTNSPFNEKDNQNYNTNIEGNNNNQACTFQTENKFNSDENKINSNDSSVFEKSFNLYNNSITPESNQSKTSIFGENSNLINNKNNTSFVQMTIYDILQEQILILDKQIEDFNKKAKEVFEQDEILRQNLDNYKIICETLTKAETKINELDENVDYFEKILDDFSKSIVTNDNDDELILCVKAYENVADNFYRCLEDNKDTEDEVISLCKENLNYLSIIDEKLDLYEKY